MSFWTQARTRLLHGTLDLDTDNVHVALHAPGPGLVRIPLGTAPADDHAWFLRAEATRVAAIADEELAAWAEFIAGVQDRR